MWRKGRCSTHLLLRGTSLIPALVADPAAGLLRSPLEIVTRCPEAQVGQVKNKRASEWLADFGGFILNVVLLAKSHSPNAKDQQGWQNQNGSLIDTVCLIALYYLSSDNRRMRGWRWGATLNPDCIKEQIPPSPEIPTCMAQTILWSFPSSHNRCPCNTFAPSGLLIKIARRRLYVTWLLIISFNKKEKQNKTKPPYFVYLLHWITIFGKWCYPAEFNSLQRCCNTDKYRAHLL